MGVHGLWELLAPVGRRVSVETLAGKRLAVDASIWMVQFMRAMRDDKGDMIRDAHLLGFLRRICKLLFLRVRPVFVFDGATPALKRRTLAARRRHRDAAQAKVRKTAEKLLLSHLKARKLEELAAQIKQDRAKHDAKGKQDGSSRSEEIEETNGDQNQNDDGKKLEELAAQIKQDRAKHDAKGKQVGSSRGEEAEETNANQNINEDGKNSGGTVAPNNQEKLDEMLAASLAAEDQSDLTDKGKHHSASDPLQEGSHIDEDDDDDDDDGEMIFPMATGDIDPAVLSSLPPSMQLDLLVQMREGLMAENRQKYQKIIKEPAKFSELQIQSYLKTVAFRREIDEVQRCAAGRGVGGVQTSKIASEANREFIFSSSFTGDKQTLTQRGGKEQVADSVNLRTLSSAVSKFNSPGSSRTIKPHSSGSLRDYGPDVETYRDERGRIRVSRVRAMGVRMTRDIQRNLDFIKEHEQVKSRQQTKVGKGSTSSNEPPDFPEHLFESSGLETSLGLVADFAENVNDNNHNSSSLAGGSDNISDSPCHGSKQTIEISFMDDQTEVKDNDDQVFLHLVSGSSSNLFADDDCSTKKPAKSDDSECIWEEGVIEREKLPVEIDHKAHQPSLLDNYCVNDEVEWEEGGCDVPGVPSSSENNQCKLPKGDLEEEALIQEAIKRSIEDFENQGFETVVHEDLQASIMSKSLQFNDDIFKLSGSPRKTHSHHESALVKNSVEEMGTEINYEGNAVMHDSGVLEVDRQEGENQVQLENNDGQADISKAYSLNPPCNISSSTLATKPSNSSKVQDSDVMVYTTTTPERTKDDSGNIIKQNRTGSYHSKCNTDDAYIVESSKSPRKDMVVDELVVDTAIHKENLVQGDINISTSEMNYTKTSRSMSTADVEKEISLLRQEQIDLGNERRKLESHAESVSSEMFAECQELLQMFGLPYIIAPMEAEAQCAYMEMNNLVDGVVTDDSDVFLFGARNVYKNIFDDRKYVETYFMKDIESELGLTREQLIRMAMLLGSDYTEGISGIGIVNAIEVIHAFPEEDGLQKFREWIESPDPTILGKLDMETGSNSKKRVPNGNSSDEKGNNQEAESVESSYEKSSNETQQIKKTFMSKHRNVSKNWHIPSTFPSEIVRIAYINPQVDDSAEPFSWGRPDSGILRKLCWERFGWSKEKANELLVPVLREYNKHETQLRMEAFYSFNERFAKIRSKRIKKAIKGITGKSFAETDELHQDSPSTSSATKKKGRNSSSDARAKRRRNNNAVPANMGSQEDKKIGDPNSFADMDEVTVSSEKISSPSDSSRGRGRSRGRGWRRVNVGHETTGSRVDSGVIITLASDEDSHEKHIDNCKTTGLTLRRSNRKRKQVTYVEDGQEADGTDVSMYQIDENNTSQASEEGNIAGQDTRSNMAHQDMTELNSDQMHKDINENPSELCADHPMDSASKDYLFSGGGFCMEEGDEQDTAGDRSDAEIGDGTSGACEDISAVSDIGKIMGSSTTGECTENASMEDLGASSSLQRRNASRGLSAMPTLTKRRRKS